MTSSNTSAATPERKLATCQAPREVALIAAPPVENRSAAPTICSREIAGDDMPER